MAVLKDPDLREYYEATFSMYATLGWKKLMEDIAYMESTHDTVAGIETGEQLHFRKGQINQILWLKNHQAAAEASYNQLIAAQEGTPEEAPTGGVARVVG